MHVPQALYVKDVHVADVEHAWLRTGLPPAHPDGELEATDLVWVPLVHDPQAPYVKEVHVVVLPLGWLVASPGKVLALISTIFVYPSPSESSGSIVLKL